MKVCTLRRAMFLAIGKFEFVLVWTSHCAKINMDAVGPSQPSRFYTAASIEWHTLYHKYFCKKYTHKL